MFKYWTKKSSVDSFLRTIFNITWGILIYRVEIFKIWKHNFIKCSERDWGLKLSTTSIFHVFRVFLESTYGKYQYASKWSGSQYFWRSSCTANKMFINIMDNSFVKHWKWAYSIPLFVWNFVKTGDPGIVNNNKINSTNLRALNMHFDNNYWQNISQPYFIWIAY